MPSIPERIPAQTVLGKLIRLPLLVVPRTAVVRVLKGVNRGFKWIVGSSTHGCWLGTYESEKQCAISRFVKPGMTVFDIGAHAAFYTLAFSRLVGETGKVWAFEPLAGKVDYLLRHIRLNLLDNVKLMQAAVADKNGIATLALTGDASMAFVSDSGY